MYGDTTPTCCAAATAIRGLETFVAATRATPLYVTLQVAIPAARRGWPRSHDMVTPCAHSTVRGAQANNSIHDRSACEAAILLLCSPVVLDGIVCPSWQELGNLSPAVAQLRVFGNDGALLHVVDNQQGGSSSVPASHIATCHCQPTAASACCCRMHMQGGCCCNTFVDKDSLDAPLPL